jgi:hypothetical protein
MAVHTKCEVSFKQYKGKQNRYRERMGKLTKHIEIGSIQKFRKNIETKQEKIFTNMG